MKAIKIVSSNEALLYKAALSINASLVKLIQVNDAGFLYYKIVNPFSQQDIFYLGIAYAKLVAMQQT